MTDYSHYTDEVLCTQLPGEAGAAAFTQLYNRYSEKLYHNILKMVKDETTAEEILQEVFTKIWQKKDTLHINENFAGYLYTSSRNSVYDFLHKVKKDQELYARIKAYATEHYTHIEESLFQKENQQLLSDAIEQLSPVRRQVFELSKLEGLSYQQIADKLGITTSTVGDHLQKARMTIREYIFSRQDTLILLCLSVLLRDI